jgi:hypothetical protein
MRIGTMDWWACRFCEHGPICVMRRNGMAHIRTEADGSAVCEWFTEEPDDVGGDPGRARPSGWAGGDCCGLVHDAVKGDA